ncbi:MAG: S41 family peptidase [Candidatus Saccharimonadales bacterium]
MWRYMRVLKTKKFRDYSLVVVAVAAVFGLGLLVGNGQLRLSSFRNVQTGLPSKLNYSSVNTVYDTLRQNYDGKLTEAQILDGLKHGLATATSDPYTEFFTAKEAKDFNNELQGVSFTGVGAQLEQDSKGNVIVLAPLDGSPAAAAGLRPQDIILTINGQSANGMTVNTAISKIRGPKGTKVVLGILRNNSQQIDISITRDDIKVPTATSQILTGNIGYLQVSQFSDDTFGLVQQGVSKFQQAGVKKVILDLRDNPGGEVTSAVNISSLWLPMNKLIMQEKRGSTVVDSFNASGNNPLQGLPTVVLVNAGSASAAEITAAALADNGAATIFGEKSFGKGVVQQVIPFADGSELKVTVASWYRPNGQSINKKGITPDKVIKLTEDNYKNNQDPQKEAAIQYLLQK